MRAFGDSSILHKLLFINTGACKTGFTIGGSGQPVETPANPHILASLPASYGEMNNNSLFILCIIAVLIAPCPWQQLSSFPAQRQEKAHI